ncbi:MULTISPECIES: VOC family protein [Sporosarcina]
MLNVVHQENDMIMHATITIKGQAFMCIDSSINQEFTFTPSTSLFVACDTAAEIGRLFEQLSQDGRVLMLLSETPVSDKFGWVGDKFGVTCQLN